MDHPTPRIRIGTVDEIKQQDTVYHWHHARFDLASGCPFDLWADDIPCYLASSRNAS